jgi:NAD(P)-dependent dehydrogenase (short-subunit alcohol dehydrogenase family)
MTVGNRHALKSAGKGSAQLAGGSRGRLPFAVVTGATSGIGLEIAVRLLRLGYHVMAVGSREVVPHRLKRATPRARLEYVAADLSRQVDIDRLVETVILRTPKLAVLVHSAGVFVDDAACLADRQASHRQLAINFEGAAWLTEGLEASLIRANGTVAFLGSSAASEPSETNAMYGASKAALQTYAKALRKRLNPKGVRVVALSIGRTKTPMQARIARNEGRPLKSRYLISPETLAELIVYLARLPPDLEVTDVAVRPRRKAPNR